MLIDGLPNDSAFGRAVLGEHAGWSVSQYLQVQILDEVRIANWQRTRDAQKKHPRHYPDKSWRPGDAAPTEPEAKPMRSPAEIDAVLARPRKRAPKREV